MKCPNCGFFNEDTATFCASCGTPLVQASEQGSAANQQASAAENTAFESNPEVVQASRHQSKLPVILGGAIVAVVVATALIASVFVSTPRNMVLFGLSRSAKAIQSSNLAKSVTAMREHGSFTIDVDGGKFAESLDLGEVDGSASVTVYSAAENQGTAVSANVYMGDSELCDGFIWLTDQSVGVSSECFLGDTGYGIRLQKMSESLPNSIFDPESSTIYSLPSSLYNALVDSESAAKAVDEVAVDVSNAAADAADALRKTFKENVETDKVTETLTFGDKSSKVRTVTFSANDTAAFSMVQDMAQWALDSDSAEALIKRIGDIGEDLELSDYNMGEDLVDDVHDVLEEFLDDAEPEDYFDDFETSLTFYVARFTRQVLGFKFICEYDGSKTEISLLAGPNLSSPTEIAFICKGEQSKYSATYTISEDSAKSYAAKLKVKENSDTVLTGNISWDKKEGAFKLDLDDALTLKATMLHSGSTTSLEIDSLTFEDGSSWKHPGVALILEEDAEFPDIPRFTDLTEFRDEEDVTDIVDDVLNAAWEVMESVSDEIDG